jgi:hypothetical protein
MQPINDKKTLMKKRIPTIVGLSVLVVGLIVGVIFLGTGPGVFAPRATPETTPSKIKLTNITDAGFTVSFYTSSATPGFIKYGTDAKSVKSQSGDDRDQLSGTVGDYKLHHVTVRGLKPSTAYHYVLGTGSKASYDDNGSPFTVETAARGGAPSAAKTAYGNVLSKSGNPESGAIVYVTLPGVGEMSSLVKSSGSWAIPLSNARKSDGSGYAVISETDSLTIFVQGTSPTLTSNLNISVADSQPVSDITAGENSTVSSVPKENTDSAVDSTSVIDDEQTFLVEDIEEEDLLLDDTNSLVDSIGGVNEDLIPLESSSISDSTQSGGLGDVAIEELGVPENDYVDLDITVSQIITTQQPKIGGLIIPNTKVMITVNSETQIEIELTSSDDGYFLLDIETLKETLEPGDHTATYTYVDPETGEDVTKTVTFTVDPVEGGVGGSETTPFGSGNPFSIEDASESAESTDSGEVATRSATPATDSAVPVSGSVGTTMALLIGGMFFIMAGGWSYYLATQIEVKEI